MVNRIGDAVLSNAHQSLRFKVTKSDIENGQPNDPCNCAAARALKRTLRAHTVEVYRDVTYVVQTRDAKSGLKYHTSPQLRLETVVFDREGNFYPGEYDLYPYRDQPSKPKRAGATTGTKSRRNVLGSVRHSIPNVRPTASQRGRL